MSDLKRVLREKFGTPQNVMKALDLDESLLKDPAALRAAIVGDSHPTEIKIMAKEKLSRAGVFLHGVLASALLPKLAKDAAIDLSPVLASITAKTFKDQKGSIVAALKKATTGKLAKDASLDDVTGLLDKMEKAGVDELDPNSATPMAGAGGENDDDEAMDDEGTIDRVKAYLATKLTPEEMAEFEATCLTPARDEDLSEEEKAKRAKEEEDKKAADAKRAKDEADAKAAGEKDKPDMVDKKAMDSALEKTAKDTETKVMARMQAIADAKEAVDPYVGKIKVAMDSAETVYRTALAVLGMDEAKLKDVPLNALQLLLGSQKKQGEGQRETTTIAQDAASAKGFYERFPDAQRLGVAR